MKYSCKYCGLDYKTSGGLGNHKRHCKENPDEEEFRENFAKNRRKHEIVKGGRNARDAKDRKVLLILKLTTRPAPNAEVAATNRVSSIAQRLPDGIKSNINSQQYRAGLLVYKRTSIKIAGKPAHVLHSSRLLVYKRTSIKIAEQNSRDRENIMA
eukprot:g3147.t1